MNLAKSRLSARSFYFRTVVVLGLLGSFSNRSRADQWDPPASYYNAATGTGATLKSQLTTIMSTGHLQRTYGDFRFSAAIHDQDPAHAGNIRLVYNDASVPGAWDSAATWNREHIWPDSRQPGSVTNASTGNLGDPHSLRPSNPQINSDRGNLPFGFETTTGSYRNLGTSWFPGDLDKGDVARSLFYSDTRWTSSGLSLTDAAPTGNQMGDLSSLIAWNYLDPPDDFERRRNHTIYSQALNPQYYTNNRNAFTDHPEYVWSLYVDQQNDSSIAIRGGTIGSGGATTSTVNLGSVLVGAPVPAAQTVTLDKSGPDGTYYSVTTSGSATSSLSGRFNAFRTSATDTRTLSVGLNTITTTAGLRSGSVVVDNLDVTTSGGAGKGANDGNDTINVSMAVLDHARPSFLANSQQTVMVHDFGILPRGSMAPEFDFSLFNLNAPSGFTAKLELDSITGSGNTNLFTTDLTTLVGASAISAGTLGSSFSAHMSTSSVGSFAATYHLNFSDENLAGAQSLPSMDLILVGQVRHRFSTQYADQELARPLAGVSTVPEPASIVWTLAILSLSTVRRRR